MKEKATGMTMKKLTMIVVVLVLLLAEGCQNSDQKLRKLQQQSEQLISENKYEDAIEICDKGLDSGLSSDDIYLLIESIYTSWAMNEVTNNGTNVTPSLQIFDQMIERYPDLKDSGEKDILDLGKWVLESYGEDVGGMRKVFESFIELYYDSDTICEGLDAIFMELAQDILKRKTDELINDGLLESIDADSYEEVFRKIDEFRLYCYQMVLSYHFVFPYVRALDNGQTLKIEYVNSFFTIYYGQLDNQGQKTGEAVQLTYAVNMKEQEKYQEEYLRGQFRDDMVNGEFKEYVYKCSGNPITALNSGKMLENRYEGEIHSHYEYKDWKADYVFTFEKGIVIPLGKMVNYPGYYGVGIDETTDPDNPAFFSYLEENLETERGFYPYYSGIYQAS